MPSIDQMIAKLAAMIPNLPNMPALPPFPQVPTLADIMARVRLPDFDFGKLFSMINFPGLPALPSLPNPLIPSFDIPDINMMKYFTAMMTNFSMGVTKVIFDFV